MLAGANVSTELMKRALVHTGAMLEAASDLDMDATAEDRALFAALKTELDAHVGQLAAVEDALQDHDLGMGVRAQARVWVGDAVLDQGVRSGNTLTKHGLRGKSGLGSTHVFGQRVEELTGAPIRLEPARVTEAATRLDDVADFEGKAAIQADLVARALQQDRLLEERDQGQRRRDQLVSNISKTMVDAADVLIKIRATLQGRFPRRRLYVSRFLLDVRPARRPEAVIDGGSDVGAETDEASAAS